MFINVYKDLIILELKLFDMIVLFCIICILFYIWELMVVLGIMVFDSLILMWRRNRIFELGKEFEVVLDWKLDCGIL